MIGPMRTKILHASPEVLKGMPADARADVFSLGVMLYAATVGRMPFEHESTVEILRQILLEDPPRPSALAPGYPPGLEAIVLKALAKDPAERYPSPAALADALDAFANDAVLIADDAALGERVRSLVGDARIPTR